MKLNIGSGTKKADGFTNVDIIAFDEVDIVADLRERWPWDDESIEEILCDHFIEHFDPLERAHMMNEMYRVLKPGGKITLSSPYGFSERAFGDPTHKWPPVVGFWFYYLNSEWREREAPHLKDILKCNFSATWGYAMHPEWQVRANEAQTFAAQWYTNAIMDIIATLIKQ